MCQPWQDRADSISGADSPDCRTCAGARHHARAALQLDPGAQSLGGRIGQAYNQAYVHNWEYYPLTDREIDFAVKALLTIADPALFKIIVHGDKL